MDKGAWQAIVHRLARVEHDLAIVRGRERERERERERVYYTSELSIFLEDFIEFLSLALY